MPELNSEQLFRELNLIQQAIQTAREEAQQHADDHRSDIAATNARLDTLNGRTRKVETTVAIHSKLLAILGAIGLAGIPLLIGALL